MKDNLKFILITLLLTCSSHLFAINNDSEKFIHINSDSQYLDIKNDIATFTGNVIILQGSIKIRADQVVIIRLDSDNKKIIIDAIGNPATFYQCQNTRKVVQGYSKKIHYNLENNRIELITDAYLEQLNSNIKSDTITYLIKEKKMKAYSSNGKRVTTTLLVRSQFKKINSASASVGVRKE